ncbi:PREDICTED: serine/threonine-protein kinase LMTK2-like [Thamnophis sirtalis]|uniref:Serine/threonine-protein kinase LMTK2-like n=1 Tax=Thamnophis sirtalis TaxID=35019 RepID=A0A6I9XRQ6_9SAUR|nr:PREDICTED: serine/threonine-protein kinase LMTK2-like [Thamnophis sirtalis]
MPGRLLPPGIGWGGLGLLCCWLGGGQTAPLPPAGPGEETAFEVSYSLVVLSAGGLLVLILLLVNCISCCKDQEINFKEFEDNFDDELDFTPPAEDTPTNQSPAEVFTLTVPSVSLPAPSQFQLPTGRSVIPIWQLPFLSCPLHHGTRWSSAGVTFKFAF